MLGGDEIILKLNNISLSMLIYIEDEKDYPGTVSHQG